MVRKLFFVLALGLWSCSGVLGQAAVPESKGEVRGRVVDASLNTPLEFATISVYSEDSVLVTGGITDQDGAFRFALEPGGYYLEVQFIAYHRQTIPEVNLPDRKKVVDLGTIRLEQSVKNLSEVTVQAQKSEMVIGVDRKIFNVGKDLGNTGNSAAEILDNIPTVAVDAEGNVTLRGSGGVRILIDGKPSGLVNSGNTDALRALQGNMIDRVEVITNPSARYEAEGMTGIINIVLKKDQRKGVHGSFEGSLGQPADYSVGANVNFRRDKINYFFNYGIDYSKRNGDGKSDQMFPQADPPFRTTVSRDRLRSGWSQNFRGGADLFIDSKTTLTAAALMSFDDEDNTSDILYRDYWSGESTPYKESRRYDHEKETEKNLEFSLNLEKQFENEEHKLNAFVQYLEDSETEDSEVDEVALDPEPVDDPLFQQVLNQESEKNWLMQADYIYPFGNEGRFEAGLRGEFRKITNPYKVEEKQGENWVTLPEFTNDFDYDENVFALYLQGANKFGPVGIQLGLRGENSDIETYLGQNDVRNARSYFDFFPTAHITYNFNTYNAWQLSYSRRIQRPHFWLLNPFYGFSDARNIRTGNPDLEPEYTNAYESGYVYTPGATSFYLGVYYRHTTGVIERISYVDDKGITFYIPQNLSVRHAYGAETNLSVDPFKWWSLSGNINFYRMQTEGIFEYNDVEKELSSDTWSWDTRVNSRMNWDNDLSFQTTFFYRGQQKTTQGLLKPFYMLNTTLSKDVMKGKGTLSLSVRDLFNSRKFRYQIDQSDLISDNTFRWSSRQIRLSFVYRLNQLKRPPKGGGENEGGVDMGF
jgi:outer membrane receptor protein involved in Fe transport